MAHSGTITIQQYVELADEAHAERYRNQSAAEVLMHAVPAHIPDWNAVMRKGGYYHVIPNWTHTSWSYMHEWLQCNIGREHYAWNGENFWFETEKAATWFALKFA